MKLGHENTNHHRIVKATVYVSGLILVSLHRMINILHKFVYYFNKSCLLFGMELFMKNWLDGRGSARFLLVFSSLALHLHLGSNVVENDLLSFCAQTI